MNVLNYLNFFLIPVKIKFKFCNKLYKKNYIDFNISIDYLNLLFLVN